MKMLLPAAVVVLAVFALAAGGTTAATSPREIVAQAKAEWLKELRASDKEGDRAARFPSPSRKILLRRLHKAAALYGFRIVSVRMLPELQAVPVIVIASNDESAISRATPKIIDLFDPRQITYLDPSGYAYEAYFLTAQTTKGMPYLATFNHWRPPHVGGGEWAVRGDLLPFPHG